jgi:UDP-glucuronate 4-epimerase
MKILVTGSAGFIGFHLTKYLLERGDYVIGIDNLNDYYDVGLKIARLSQLGINEIKDKSSSLSVKYLNFKFIKLDIENFTDLSFLFSNEKFDIVVNLAAQAGVRYSLENPRVYIESNIVGFFNILECCKQFKINHLLYASSSSVYGKNEILPFSTIHKTESPLSLYAATKKTNELLAHSYSHLYKLRTTGLRFFTVYGPWGRPDMAYYLFADAIRLGKPINVFNDGIMMRDFTYIRDIINSITKVLDDDFVFSDEKHQRTKSDNSLFKIYNIGNGLPVNLFRFVEILEKEMGVLAIKIMSPMQAGDVEKTWADMSDFKLNFDYTPNTQIEEGVKEFIDWYKDYHK